jgi:Transposase IS66 family
MRTFWTAGRLARAEPLSEVPTVRMLERWPRLTHFVDDPRIPPDNSAAERALRGPVVGRKNCYGSRSVRGTQVAAIVYTLCETARLVGVDRQAYLLQAIHTVDIIWSTQKFLGV